MPRASCHFLLPCEGHMSCQIIYKLRRVNGRNHKAMLNVSPLFYSTTTAAAAFHSVLKTCNWMTKTRSAGSSLLHTKSLWHSSTSSSHGGGGGTTPVVASLRNLHLQLGKKTKGREVVIPQPDYRIPVVLTGLAGVSFYQENLLVAAPLGLLGLLLLFQEVKVGDQLEESGENVFVGGKNRWKYSTFVNWELWWPNFPILVYFKETQTKPEGQVHFFPVIFNGKQLYNVMAERTGPSKTSGPKGS